MSHAGPVGDNRSSDVFLNTHTWITGVISLCLDPHRPQREMSYSPGLKKSIWLRHARWAEKEELESKSGACNPLSVCEKEGHQTPAAVEMVPCWEGLNEARWP